VPHLLNVPIAAGGGCVGRGLDSIFAYTLILRVKQDPRRLISGMVPFWEMEPLSLGAKIGATMLNHLVFGIR
jgi:hypothetical protein